MLRPFVAYLRVYEPLSAFGDPPDERLVQAVEQAQLTRSTAGEREHLMWLKSQITIPPRLLPAELANGEAAPSTTTDVLVLDPSDVPGEKDSDASPRGEDDTGEDDTGEDGPEPLVCPLELRVRSAAALVGFLGDAHPALRAAVLDSAEASAEHVRDRANAALRDLHGTTMHVLSTTWTVPLPWFALVDPDQRRLVLGDGQHDLARELSWRVPIGDALRRAAEAEELVHDTLGESGPAQILAETNRWLSNFDPRSAVELDYGGIVQLIEDSLLETDTSADEVHSILEALRAGEAEEVAESFQTLRDYWSDLASRERFN